MNDAANRSGGRGSGTVPRSSRRASPPEPEEQLEFGEPIEDEAEKAQPPKRIRARVVPFDGQAPERANRNESSEPAGTNGGQMVLTTAKYMPAQPPEPPRDRKGRPAPEEKASSFEGQVLNSGKWGGVLAMAVAGIWFMAGWANDVIFFYPPVLFFIGLVSFMKGTMK